jgi:Fe-S cluster assembly iron-binding protein IscA
MKPDLVVQWEVFHLDQSGGCSRMKYVVNVDDKQPDEDKVL